MSRKRPVRGSEPEEAYEGDLEDALMLDEPGTIVEPDVRKALLRYFKDMKMLEGAYLSPCSDTKHENFNTVRDEMRAIKNRIRKAVRRAVLSEAAGEPVVKDVGDGYEVYVRDGRFVDGFSIEEASLDGKPRQLFVARHYDVPEDMEIFSTAELAVEWAKGQLAERDDLMSDLEDLIDD